jgi:hypothetical protein
MNEDIGSFIVDLVDKYLGVKVNGFDAMVEKVLIVGSWHLTVVDFRRCQVESFLLRTKHAEEVYYSAYIFPWAF